MMKQNLFYLHTAKRYFNFNPNTMLSGSSLLPFVIIVVIAAVVIVVVVVAAATTTTILAVVIIIIIVVIFIDTAKPFSGFN